MMLYSAVMRFLVAMNQFQYSRRTRRPRGKHVCYEDVICKMASIQYTIECAAYCLVMLASNAMGPAYYFSMLAPPLALVACILVWITVVRNVSQFDVMLTQTVNIIFVLVVLTHMDFTDRVRLVIYFLIQIINSIIDAISCSIAVTHTKRLESGSCGVLFCSTVSQVLRCATVVTFYVSVLD